MLVYREAIKDMPDSDAEQLQVLLKGEILCETSKIAWPELQRFFAAGKAIAIAQDLDLVEVALQMSNDNSDRVREWMRAGKVAPVSNQQAKRWFETDATVWAVVVKPWLLVQTLKPDRNGH